MRCMRSPTLDNGVLIANQNFMPLILFVKSNLLLGSIEFMKIAVVTILKTPTSCFGELLAIYKG